MVFGIGFLGTGTIMKEGVNVRGLNTAATLWGSAAAGACSGAEQWAPTILAAIFVLSANTLLARSSIRSTVGHWTVMAPN